MRQVIHYKSKNRIFVSNSDDWRYQSREWRYCWNSASWEIHLITAENSIRAENNWDDNDSDINNKKDFCFSFIESIESSHNHINENRINIDDHDLSSSKKHKRAKKMILQAVFKISSELKLYYNWALQDHENTASSNRSSEIDDSQNRWTWIFNSKVKRCLTFHR